MALKKFKQKTPDAILIKAAKAEHGFATFAHLNVIVDYINTNAEPELIPAVVGRLLGQLPIVSDLQVAYDDGVIDYGDAYLTPQGSVAVFLD